MKYWDQGSQINSYLQNIPLILCIERLKQMFAKHVFYFNLNDIVE